MKVKKRYKYSKVVKSLFIALWAIPFFLLALSFVYKTSTIPYFPILLIISFLSSVFIIVYWVFETIYEKKHARLFNAIIKSDIGALILETKDKPLYELKKYKSKGMSLLELAIYHNSKPFIVHYLLYKNMLLNTYYSDQQNINHTLLHLAVNYPYTDLDIVKLLVEKGALINQEYNNKLSLLQVFCIKGDFETVKYLIEQGADIHHVSQELDLSVIMTAAKYCNNSEIIALLIQQGARHEEINRDGYNALLFACEFNTEASVLKTILRYSLDDVYQYYMIIDRNGKINQVNALYLAALNKNKEVITTLIRHGYEVNYIDNFGMTPLFIACLYNKNPDVIYELIVNGANVNSRDKYDNTPLMAACYKNENHVIPQMLIKYGAEKSAINSQGYTYVNYLNKNKAIHHNSKQRIIMLRA